jgi:hypothetical protein
VRSISEVFVSGRPVAGVVSMVRFIKDRGRIEYTYEYESRAYTSGNAVMKSKRTQAFSPGQSVTVYVNPSEPATAFLGELYL